MFIGQCPGLKTDTDRKFNRPKAVMGMMIALVGRVRIQAVDNEP